MIVQAVVPAAVLMGVPVLIGMTYHQLHLPPAGELAAASALSTDEVPIREAPNYVVGPPPPPAIQVPAANGGPLTARELMVLNMVAEGLTNAQIATELSIGRETVKTHIGNILAKLGARDRTHAVNIAHRSHLIGEQ